MKKKLVRVERRFVTVRAFSWQGEKVLGRFLGGRRIVTVPAGFVQVWFGEKRRGVRHTPLGENIYKNSRSPPFKFFIPGRFPPY